MKNYSVILLPIVFLIVIVILLRNGCIKTHEVKVEKKELRSKYDSLQDKIDSLREIISSDSGKIESLKNYSSLLGEKYAEQKDFIKKKWHNFHRQDSVIKLYHVSDIEAGFQKRYNLPSSDSIVSITKQTGVAALLDLSHYDTLKNIIPYYIKADSALNARSIVQDSIINMQDRSLDNYRGMIGMYSNQKALLVKQRDIAEKQVRFMKRNNFGRSVAELALLILYIIKK